MSEIKKGVLKDFKDNPILPYTTQDQVEGLVDDLANKQAKIDADHKLSSDLIDGDLGTKVEANPEDEATESLSKIKIGDDIYSVECAAPTNVVVTDSDDEQVIGTGSTKISFNPSTGSIGASNDWGYAWSTIELKANEGSSPSIRVSSTDHSLCDFTFDLNSGEGIFATQEWVESWAEEKGYTTISGDNDGTHWTSLTIGDEFYEIPQVSGDNDGENWTSLTIGSDTYNIPQGGGSDVSGECFPYDYEGAAKWWSSITIGDVTASLSKVRANLVHETTDILTSLEVDDINYAIKTPDVNASRIIEVDSLPSLAEADKKTFYRVANTENIYIINNDNTKWLNITMSFPSTTGLDSSKTYNLQYVNGQMVWNEAAVELPAAEDESFGDDETEESGE